MVGDLEALRRTDGQRDQEPVNMKAQALTGVSREMAEDLEREPRGTCNRWFAPSVLVRHEPMCAGRAAKAAGAANK